VDTKAGSLGWQRELLACRRCDGLSPWRSYDRGYALQDDLFETRRVWQNNAARENTAVVGEGMSRRGGEEGPRRVERAAGWWWSLGMYTSHEFDPSSSFKAQFKPKWFGPTTTQCKSWSFTGNTTSAKKSTVKQTMWSLRTPTECFEMVMDPFLINPSVVHLPSSSRCKIR
jgi:hypothetical protein